MDVSFAELPAATLVPPITAVCRLLAGSPVAPSSTTSLLAGLSTHLLYDLVVFLASSAPARSFAPVALFVRYAAI